MKNKGSYTVRDESGNGVKSGKANSLDEVIRENPGKAISWSAPEDWGRTPQPPNRYNPQNTGE